MLIMYVAVKGGESAIRNSQQLLAEERRGDKNVAELNLDQIQNQLSLAVDRVMAEGSLYDRELAALAIKQSRGDLVEAIFLLRAYRTTLPRFGTTIPIETSHMSIRRRISATFKDLPGGQVLGPSFDYTHRLLDFSLIANGNVPEAMSANDEIDKTMPRVTDLLNNEGLIEQETTNDTSEPFDITRESLKFPTDRPARLQNLARGDEGFLLALAYSTQRGWGRNHPFAGEIRMGELIIEFIPDELDFAIEIGEVTITECQMINQFKGSSEIPAQFTRGYGLSFGHNERKTMAMGIVDRALRTRELDEQPQAPAQDEEFVLSHSCNVEASGFVQHLKLPHYVDFQSELVTVRALRDAIDIDGPGSADSNPDTEAAE